MEYFVSYKMPVGEGVRGWRRGVRGPSRLMMHISEARRTDCCARCGRAYYRRSSPRDDISLAFQSPLLYHPNTKQQNKRQL